MDLFEKHATKTSQESLALTEDNQSLPKFILTNPSERVYRWMRPESAMRGNKQNCDFMIRHARDYEIFVELKTTASADAIKQIIDTINLLSCSPHSCPKLSVVLYRKGYTSSVKTRSQRSIAELQKKYMSSFVIRQNQYEADLDNLLPNSRKK